MNKYTVEFFDWGKPAGDLADAIMFRVHANGITFPVAASISATVAAEFHNQYSNEDITIRKALLLFALPRLRTMLDDFEPPLKTTDEILLKVTVLSDNLQELLNCVKVKDCSFQKRARTGLICDVSTPPDNRTSESICLGCNLPDDRLRCSRISHPSVQAGPTIGRFFRTVTDALCSIKSTTFDPALCLPGGHECWRLIVDQSPKIEAISADIGERAIDELSHLNLAFYKTFGRSLWKSDEPRSSANVVLSCSSQEEFVSGVACIVDILNKFDIGEKVLGSDGKQVTGSLQALQLFLQQKTSLPNEHPIQMLRQIVEIRNSFPIHSGNKQFINACTELGIEFPIRDWARAWNIIRYQFSRSLRLVRQGLKT
jgi:hypothetical protein